MINPFSEVNWRPALSDYRKFGRSLLIGFPIIGLVILVAGIASDAALTWRPALLISGGGVAIGLLFLSIPTVVKPFYFAWFFVACCIGFVIANLILALIFYIAVTGVGLAARLRPHQPIRNSPRPHGDTYWNVEEPPTSTRQYFRQF